MKRIFMLIIACAMFLCMTACAKTYKMQPGVNMEDDLTDGVFHVGFTMSDVSDTDISASVYEPVSYDLVDVHDLAVGDTLETADGDMKIASKQEDENGCIQLNGGAEAGGVTLRAFDEDNCYHAMNGEEVRMLLKGQMQLTLADQVTISGVTVAAADVAGQLAAIADDFAPSGTKAVVENGVLIELIIDETGDAAGVTSGLETLTLDNGISLSYDKNSIKIDVDENGNVDGSYLGAEPGTTGFNIVVADTEAETYMTEAAKAHETELTSGMCFADAELWLYFTYDNGSSEEYTSEVTVYARDFEGGCYLVTVYDKYENGANDTEELRDAQVAIEQVLDSLSFTK